MGIIIKEKTSMSTSQHKQKYQQHTIPKYWWYIPILFFAESNCLKRK